jgi:hypothetical protein
LLFFFVCTTVVQISLAGIVLRIVPISKLLSRKYCHESVRLNCLCLSLRRCSLSSVFHSPPKPQDTKLKGGGILPLSPRILSHSRRRTAGREPLEVQSEVLERKRKGCEEMRSTAADEFRVPVPGVQKQKRNHGKHEVCNL